MPLKFDSSSAEGLFARRVAVTLAALLVYRLGAAIPLPGLDAAALADQAATRTPLSMARLSIMALGIVPYLSALIVVEFAKMAWPRLRTWSKIPRNASRLDTGILAGALLLAAFQAHGIAVALEGVPGLVRDAGLGFRIGIAISLMAATAFVIWIATLITRHGIGSGLWILVAIPHLLTLGSAMASAVEATTTGAAHPAVLLVTPALLAVAVAGLALITTSTPPLATHDEIVWTPILGATVGNWLFGAVFLAEWVLYPEAHQGYAPSYVSLYGYLLAFLAGVAFVAVLRRRSLIEPGGKFRAATAVPLALAVMAVIIAHEIADDALRASVGAHMLQSSAYGILLLAAVGLIVVEELKRMARAAATRPS